MTLILALSWQNVIDGNGVPLALTGLSIVFSGLVIIALFIASLPKLLQQWDRLMTKPTTLAKPAVAPTEALADPTTASPEVQAALAWVAVRELEVFRLGDEQRLTLQSHRRSGMWRTISTLRDKDTSD